MQLFMPNSAAKCYRAIVDKPHILRYNTEIKSSLAQGLKVIPLELQPDDEKIVGVFEDNGWRVFSIVQNKQGVITNIDAEPPRNVSYDTEFNKLLLGIQKLNLQPGREIYDYDDGVLTQFTLDMSNAKSN